MSWLEIIGLLLKAVLQWWIEYRAEHNEDDEVVRTAQERRAELYDALAGRNSGKISRMAALRRDRLRGLLNGLSEDDKPAS